MQIFMLGLVILLIFGRTLVKFDLSTRTANKTCLKEVPLHAPITWNTFQCKQENTTNVTCFRGQRFSCLEGT